MNRSNTALVEDAPAFAPYLPRLVVNWLAETPETSHRRIDGTMVFVDVSGFTALSERLARRGKAGAEELTEILDGIFTSLLTRAWEMGGGLVKFGGDALLLLFTGERHSARACAAAFDMQRELANSGRLDTSGGEVVLRMSVGIHSGAFDFFLVGDSHQELILTGPASTRTLEAESAADAGQVLVTSETAPMLDPAVLGPRLDDWFLLAGRPDVKQCPPVGRDDVERLPLRSCIPVALHRQLSGASEPEHRVVTVAFLHFMGVDELLATEGPARVADALTTVVAAAQRHLDPLGVCFLGSDLYEDGAKLIFIAGAPEAAENDEERMLRALRSLVDEPGPLRLRAGVNRGHVYAGEVGPPMRRTYTVMGDAVNLAARLMQKAVPGTIFVTQGVLDRSATEFATEPLEPFFVKGKARPIQAYRLGEVVGRKRSTTMARLPLVGRQREVETLQSALRSAWAGSGQVVAVAGPAGIGKSRLVEEARAWAQDEMRLTILCEQYEISTPYWPLRWLFRRILGIPFEAEPNEAGHLLREAIARVDEDLLPWLPLLAIPADASVPATEAVDALDEAFRRDRLERAVLDLFGKVLRERTLILVEDLHWMDEASRSLVRKLCVEASSRPWLIILTSRDVDIDFIPVEADHVHLLRLAALSPEEAETLALAASELSPVPPHYLRELAKRSDGSPLFLIELVAGARAADTAALPESIEAAITARMDTLDPADRMLVRCASVVGISFPAHLVREALRGLLPQIHESGAWDRLAEFLVKEPGDRFRFRHALVRDVAYEGLPFRRRRHIHAMVGEHIEKTAGDHADAHAEVLALHFLRADRFHKAWRYARVAGDRARAKAANVEAAGFYGQALDAAHHLTSVPAAEIVAVAESRGDVCELAGLYDESTQSYRLARRFARHTPEWLPDLFRKEGRAQERAGRYAHSRRLYQHGLRLAGAMHDFDGAQRAQAHLAVVMAGALCLEGRYRAGIWWARRAAALSAEQDAPAVLAHAYYLLDWGYTALGEQALAKDYREVALPIYEDMGDSVGQSKVLNNLGANAYEEGNWREALDYYERGMEAAERAGDIVHAAMLTSNVAEVLLHQGELERSGRLFRDSLTMARGAGFRIGEAWAQFNLGLLAARSGRHDEGHALLTQARDMFRDIGADSYTHEAGARLAEISLLSGDHRNARAIVSRSLKEARSRTSIPVLEAMLHRLEGYALLQAGDPDHAASSFEESLVAAEKAGAIYEIALTLDAIGRMARLTGSDDDGAAERSRALLEDLGVVRTPDIPLPGTDNVSTTPEAQRAAG